MDDGNIQEDQFDNQIVYLDDGSIDGDIFNVCKIELVDFFVNYICQLEVGLEGYVNIIRKLFLLFKVFVLRVGIQVYCGC